MHTDPIADYLTRIRNAIRANHSVVSMPSSSLKEAISAVLKDHGFIRNYRISKDHIQGLLQIALKYNRESKKNAIEALNRISRPGLRKYASTKNMPRVLNGLGIAILSTSKGVMSDKEARKQHIGGEILCYIY